MTLKESTPELAVVVIAVGAPVELVEAVRSLQSQDAEAEIVVINSNGGDAQKLLRDYGMQVPVFQFSERLNVGAARNVGILKTKARYVAFLASDCLAAPLWVSERLRLHRSGEGAVASAVLPYPPDEKVAWADHLLLFPRRLPGLPADEALRYGVSFDRRVFESVGLFDEGLRTGEDTEFASRLDEQPVWAPTVITFHRNARHFSELLSDQFVRGRRYYSAMSRLRQSRGTTLVKHALLEPRRSVALIRAGLEGRDLEIALASLPVMRLGAAAKALGILVEACGLVGRGEDR